MTKKNKSSILTSQGFKKYFNNTSWLLLEKVLRILSGLVIGVWITKYLGPERFGLLSYWFSVIGIFSAFSALGLEGIVIRELVKGGEKDDEILGTAFYLKLAGSFVVVAIMLGISLSVENVESKYIIVIFSLMGILTSFNVIDFYFQSKVISKYSVYSKVVSLSIISIINIILLFNKAPLLYFAMVYLVESIILSLGYIFFYRKNKLSLTSWSFDRNVAISLLKDSWPLVITSIIISIYMKFDQIMIESMLNIEQVGQYAAAVRLSEAWYFVPMIIASSLFPALIEFKKQNEEKYYYRLQKLYDFMVWMSLAIALPMTFLSGWIVQFLYGSAYDQTGGVLVIHIWAGLFVSLGVVRGKWILAENLQIYTFIYLGIGLIVNLIANYYFIQFYGIKGAAYATLLAQAVGTLFTVLLFKKTRISFYMMINSILLIPSIIRIKKNGLL